MQLETKRQDLAPIEADSRPFVMDYEMAYQVRVVIDRIKFAIKHTEQLGRHPDQMREVGLQLLDALERLESADRHFQCRTRMTSVSSTTGRFDSAIVDAQEFS